MGIPKNIKGERFGRLTAVSVDHLDARNRRFWKCVCDCGGQKIAYVAHLNNGAVRSCGCIRRENTAALNRRHGLRKHPLYPVWMAMKQRCHNPNNRDFRLYGQRGITVCDRWRNSFAAFAEDLGAKPSPAHSIDRIDVDGNYEPGNVRWATPQEQRHNQRNSKFRHQGEKQAVG